MFRECAAPTGSCVKAFASVRTEAVEQVHNKDPRKRQKICQPHQQQRGLRPAREKVNPEPSISFAPTANPHKSTPLPSVP